MSDPDIDDVAFLTGSPLLVKDGASRALTRRPPVASRTAVTAADKLSARARPSFTRPFFPTFYRYKLFG